jgi:hypothetical protein
MQPQSHSQSGYDLTIRSTTSHEVTIPADTVIFGSGWSTGEYPFFTTPQLESLGLPLPYTDDLPEREKEFEQLDKVSLKGILGRLRTMRLMPSEWSLSGFSARFADGKTEKWAPYRLYRLMVPLDSLPTRDIAFAGIPTCKGMSGSNPQVQSMARSHAVI